MKRIVSLILAVLIFCVFLMFAACEGGERSVEKCAICGTKYYAGDAAGNYMSIARSGMCKSCKTTYDAYNEIKDYYELNP